MANELSAFPALSLDEVCDRLCAVRRPLILSHTHPDGDTVGSAAALACLFARRGETAAWMCADRLPERLAFVMQDIPLREAEPERDTVISVDVPSPQQLGALAARFLPGGVALMIDHHERGVPFAPHYILPHMSSCGEVLYGIARRMAERGDIPGIDPRMAGALYAAISSDTGCFRLPNTQESTHLAAADLIEHGAQAAEINRLLFDCKSEKQLEAEGIALSALRLSADGRIAAICLSLADRRGLADEYFDTAVDVARAVRGAEIACFIRELPDGTFKLSLRAVAADVSAVAARFGGGGHKLAAGATFRAENTEAAWQMVLPALIAALPGRAS